ncbi:MAG: 3-deoxy-7-phosphoheptulonate synthase class II [Verrucomicrobia bacterium]|nr:3-deoxy-7-phosphoheptulonate synthase class II [Verrucomicrobiota bacterium]
MNTWSPDSWKQKKVRQTVVYPDHRELQAVLQRLSKLPPLVTSWEIENLKASLAKAQRGEAFLLQGGDCSERFADCRSDVIVAKLKVLLRMSLALAYGAGCQVIRVGRLAGQYAKPRSADTETHSGVTLPVYRGDLINEAAFNARARTPDPALLLRGYERAALTLNFVRSLLQGGFADLHHPEYWDLGFVQYSARAEEYRRVVENISAGIRFVEALAHRRLDELQWSEFYTSHEGLHLDYEQAQTRQVPRHSGWYDLATHFPWIGHRTRNLDGAHVEFFRGIANPVAVKIGPGIECDELVELCRILNPENEPGRLTLICRFGAQGISKQLPPLIEAVRKAGQVVLWSCDPMHGNTRTTPSGRKTRDFGDILSELDHAFDIHRQAGTVLGGVHFELTGENVTECVGGARGLAEADLERAYRSDVDPRLNYEQALEMALLIARKMQRTMSRT